MTIEQNLFDRFYNIVSLSFNCTNEYKLIYWIQKRY